MDNWPPALRTGLPHSEIHVEQGKPITLPATAGEPRGTLLARWIKERGKSECRSVMDGIWAETLPDAKAPGAGASSHAAQMWSRADWPHIEAQVKRLQMRIAQAVREGRWNRAKVLQRLLSRSHNGKMLAVKRVTENRGKRTPGVDGRIWSTPVARWNAMVTLRHRGYRATPLRRVYIPKSNGGKRPLGIPCMRCRAMQALWKLALEPIAESLADPNSYGFRPERSTADAIGQCFITLARRTSPEWVLEGDIRGCFDSFSHAWLLEHIPMDKAILRKWLEAGYIDEGALFEARAGTPQGGNHLARDRKYGAGRTGGGSTRECRNISMRTPESQAQRYPIR